MEKKAIIYKNDLKFTSNIDIEKSEFYDVQTENLYNKYKNKPKIELRIENSKMENYNYLDLSNLNLDDDLLNKLLQTEKIINILKKIVFLDLSSNDLTKKPNLTKYKNIKYLCISKNKISGVIEDNILYELTCDNNKISNIKSQSIKVLSANNNNITQIDVPNIKVLNINNNKLNEIDEYLNLDYLECIDNKIKTIKNLYNLQEIYIANNELKNISNMPNLLILNCVNNPIEKIDYFEKVNLILSSTPIISSKYKIKNMTKIKNDYLFNI